MHVILSVALDLYNYEFKLTVFLLLQLLQCSLSSYISENQQSNDCMDNHKYYVT